MRARESESERPRERERVSKIERARELKNEMVAVEDVVDYGSADPTQPNIFRNNFMLFSKQNSILKQFLKN